MRAATYGAGVGLAALAGVMAAPMVKTQATVGRSFVDACVMRLIEGTMDPDTAAMAKLWTTETLGKAVDECRARWRATADARRHTMYLTQGLRRYLQQTPQAVATVFQGRRRTQLRAPYWAGRERKVA